MRPGDAFLALWRLARPEVWMVTFLPVVGGWVLASRELLPGLGVWTAFWDQAAATGATPADFLGALRAWWREAWRLALALVVMGPLVWTATLLINDVHDLPGDRLNPRKARSPLVRGVVSAGWARGAAHAFAAAALAVAVAVGWAFALLVAACLVLAWAYSVPPVRLKTRPGTDVLVNAVGVGALAGAAGWSLAAPLSGFPLPFLPQALLVAVAVYVPTTLVDHEADRAAGYATLATHLGPARAYRVGWWAWVAAQAGALVLAWHDRWIPRAMLPVLVVFTPLLLWQYHRLIGQARDPAGRVEGIVVCSLTFLCVNALWALLYTGVMRTG